MGLVLPSAGGVGGGWLSRKIVQANHDGRAGAGQDSGRIDPLVGVPQQVAHLAVKTVGQPLAELRGVSGRFGGGDADEVEAEVTGL